MTGSEAVKPSAEDLAAAREIRLAFETRCLGRWRITLPSGVLAWLEEQIATAVAKGAQRAGLS